MVYLLNIKEILRRKLCIFDVSAHAAEWIEMAYRVPDGVPLAVSAYAAEWIETDS